MKEFCSKGHSLAGARVVMRLRHNKTTGVAAMKSHLECRLCTSVRRKAKRRARGYLPDGPAINRAQTHCPHGHRLASVNLSISTRRWFSKRKNAWQESRIRRCKACWVECKMDLRARKLGLPKRV